MTRVAWVTGASGGIGLRVVRRLAEHDWTIIASSRERQRLEQATSDIENVCILPVDVTDETTVKDAAGKIKSDYGRLDGLVHAVGSIQLRPLHATSLDQFQDTIKLNLTSAFITMKYSLPIMMRSGGGRVVLFSSVAANVGMSNHSSIASAKAGIEGLAKAAAADYAKRGIRVNVISPGLTETPLAAHLLANENSRSISENMHPVGRIGMPEEVASTASWMISEAPDWLTGAVIPVDGGLGNIRPQETRKA